MIEGKKFIVKKLDDRTVQFIIPKPFAPFLSAVGQPILPKHVLKKYVDNGTFTSVWGVNTNPKDLIGTGAYRLVSYTVGQTAIYERNPYYWEKDEAGQKLPYVTKIKSQIIGDPDVRLIKFISRETDYYGVRATDLTELIPKAKEKNFSGAKERETIGNILKDDLKRIGVEVNFQAIDFNNLVSKLMSSFDFEAVIIGLTGSMDPYFGQNVWLSSGHLHMWNPNQKKPATKWEAKIDKLFQAAATELNPKKRDKLYKEAFKILGEQQPMIFIVE